MNSLSLQRILVWDMCLTLVSVDVIPQPKQLREQRFILAAQAAAHHSELRETRFILA